MACKQAYPRVLVISHEAFSCNTSMGRTMASYFKGWKTDNIAQLFIHSEVPTSDVCLRYYKYTDMDALISLIDRQRVGKTIDEVFAERIDASDTGYLKGIYTIGSKKHPLTYVLRDWMWKHSTWHSEHLMRWVSKFDPQIIFFAAGDYIFSNEIAVTLAVELGIPLVTCCMDDYYIFNKNQDSILGRKRQQQFMESVRKLIGQSCCVFTISELMAEAYSKMFGKKCRVLYTASSYRKPEECNRVKEGIAYLGGLKYNRNEQLVKIGRILKEIADGIVPDHLDVYSGDSDPRLTACLIPENGIVFHGSVSADDVDRIIWSNVAVVHTESFDDINRQLVKYSVSTKIPDSLASGTCLLAYGPRDVASIAYLDAHSCAFTAETEDELRKSIIDIFHDIKKREKVVERARDIAVRNHSSKGITDYVRRTLASFVT